jgi:hypothetical protein
LQDAYVGSSYRLIPKAGHLANLDNPEIFGLMLLEFLAELPAKPAREFAVMAWLAHTLARGRNLIQTFASKRGSTVQEYESTVLEAEERSKAE